MHDSCVISWLLAFLLLNSISCTAADIAAAEDRVIIQYADQDATHGSKGLRGLEIVPLTDDDTIEDAVARFQVSISLKKPSKRV